MGRFFCDRPYGYDDDNFVFCCRNCKLKKKYVQLAHINNIRYWDIEGPVVSGVLFDEVKHVYRDKKEKKVFFLNRIN